MKKLSLIGILTLLVILGGCFSKDDVVVDEILQTGDVEITGDASVVDTTLGNEVVSEVEDDSIFMPVDDDDVAEVGANTDEPEDTDELEDTDEPETLDEDTQEIFDAYSTSNNDELTEDDINFAEKIIQQVQNLFK